MEYKYAVVGTVVFIDEAKQVSQYIKKKQFKVRFTDSDFTGKIMEQVIMLNTINSSIPILDPIHVNQIVKVEFYLSGNDYEKDGRSMNFTSLQAFNIEIISDPDRDTKEDKEAVITELGRVYKMKEASDEDLLKYMVPHNDDIPDIKSNNTLNNDPLGDIKPQEQYGDLPF